MNISDTVLKNDEVALFKLRELYSKYGYVKYKVSKFEEYDLYAKNKSFLISENILTFTDTDGRLMALKPDVTLSIVKNLGDVECGTHKLYYNENVYRTSASADGFREIMQTGLECIGKLDIYDVSEVIILAQKSLDTVSEDNILDISHMGFMMGLMENLGVDGSDADKLIEYISQKNLPAIKAFCTEKSLSDSECDEICEITGMYLPIKDALSVIAGMVRGQKMRTAYDELSSICKLIDKYGNTEKIYIDFSTVNDMNYYNGIIFKGFVNGIPDSILSGGRYDSLLKKLGKGTGAIGFAVYLDMLERLPSKESGFDVDAVLLYNDESDKDVVLAKASELRACGMSVKTECADKTDIRCKKLMKIVKGDVVTVE